MDNISIAQNPALTWFQTNKATFFVYIILIFYVGGSYLANERTEFFLLPIFLITLFFFKNKSRIPACLLLVEIPLWMYILSEGVGESFIFPGMFGTLVILFYLVPLMIIEKILVYIDKKYSIFISVTLFCFFVICAFSIPQVFELGLL